MQNQPPRYRIAILGLTSLIAGLLACDPYDEHARVDRASRELADAGVPPVVGCEYTDCGLGRHCEMQCEPRGTDGCADNCVRACEPDDTCGDVRCADGETCVAQWINSCGQFAHIGFLACQKMPDVGACAGAITCSTPPPSCPVGTVPGIADGCYTGGCVPTAACDGAAYTGGCDASTVTCTDRPPLCPAGTTPGVVDGCWSGACLPDTACTCDKLGTEAQCAARSDCVAVTGGQRCSCADRFSCSCSDETGGGFQRCREANFID